MVYLILIILGIFGSVGYTMLMKKSYLLELQKPLDIKEFQLNYGFGKVSVVGKWKSVPIEITAEPRMSAEPARVVYTLTQQSPFTALIKPGTGFMTKEAAAQKKKSAEEDTARPWRVKLTEEEQAVIDKRRSDTGVGVTTQAPKEKYDITSPKAEDVSKYMAESSVCEALDGLFQAGFASVRIDHLQLVAVKAPYVVSDIAPRAVEQHLKLLRDLLVSGRPDAK